MAVGCAIDATLANRRSTVQPGHVRLGTGFIEENEVIPLGESPGDREVAPTLNDIRPILFGGDQRLLLSDSPSRLSARHTVDSTTCTLSIGINCFAVMPGCAATVSRMHCSSAAVSLVGPLGPGVSGANSSRRWRSCQSQTVGHVKENRRATDAIDSPDSNANTTRLRKSIEYDMTGPPCHKSALSDIQG